MPLSKDAQIRTLKMLGIPDDAINEIVNAEEERDYTMPEGVQVYDKTGLEQLTANIKKGYQKDYPEIWCRQMNEEHELGLTGKDAKDQKKVMEAMKQKALKEANVTPTEWEGKFKTLQETIDEKSKETLTYKEKYENLISDGKYRTLFWAERNDALDDTEWIERLKKNFEIVTEDGVEGLRDKSTGKFITDEKLNVLPYKEAFAAEIAKDKYKSWHKVKAAEPAQTPPRPSHDPRSTNPALQKAKKYKSTDDILKEVEKKYPSDSKLANLKKLRQDYFQQLSREMAA